MQGIVWQGLRQALQAVVGVACAALVAADFCDVASWVVLVAAGKQALGGVAAGFDLDASKALQGIGRLGDDGPGGADLLGKEPVVAVDADLALVGQLDLAQASFVVAEALAAAVGEQQEVFG